jgi:hypothetical protein
MELNKKPGTLGSHAFLKAALLLAFGTCALMFSCKAPPIWSAEARSPDGKMIAAAETFENRGFGTGYSWTGVYLNWTTGSRPQMEILEFSDATAAPGGMNVGMNWLTPTHLELTYHGGRPILFQAVKCAGIDISLRDLSDEKLNNSK